MTCDLDINLDLLAILLIYSLPASFEVFRCAIESWDDLPSLESLRIKNVEDRDAQKSCASGGGDTSGAMVPNKNGGWRKDKEKAEVEDGIMWARNFAASSADGYGARHPSAEANKGASAKNTQGTSVWRYFSAKGLLTQVWTGAWTEGPWYIYVTRRANS